MRVACFIILCILCILSMLLLGFAIYLIFALIAPIDTPGALELFKKFLLEY